MKRVITCTRCGAPLKSGKCEYCGTEFDTDDFVVRKIVYETRRPHISEQSCMAIIPIDIIDAMGAEEAAQMVESNLAEQLARDIAKYMDISTYVDAVTMEQRFRGRIKFVLPE